MKITVTQGKLTVEFSEGERVEVVADNTVEVSGNLADAAVELQSEANLDNALENTDTDEDEDYFDPEDDETNDALDEVNDELEELAEQANTQSTSESGSIDTIQTELELQAAAAAQPVASVESTSTSPEDIAKELELAAAEQALQNEARLNALTPEQRALAEIQGELNTLAQIRRI